MTISNFKEELITMNSHQHFGDFSMISMVVDQSLKLNIFGTKNWTKVKPLKNKWITKHHLYKVQLHPYNNIENKKLTIRDTMIQVL